LTCRPRLALLRGARTNHRAIRLSQVLPRLSRLIRWLRRIQLILLLIELVLLGLLGLLQRIAQALLLAREILKLRTLLQTCSLPRLRSLWGYLGGTGSLLSLGNCRDHQRSAHRGSAQLV
jgi:hypothetical protein